ncbi:MAG: cytochrome b/b6 domain-containing protein [Janthinobacterium lividum]
MAATTLGTVPVSETMPVVHKHHWLVRVTHWMNIPLLTGLVLSGISIYWAAPVYTHPADANGNEDYLADIGFWIARHEPWRHSYGTSDNWVPGTHYSTSWLYDHFSLGTGMLSTALNLHWLFAYLFIANGLLYLLGLGLGGGYKSLLPRRTDFQEAVRMQIYYVGLPFAKITRRTWTHPIITTKYNALQRGAYFSMPIFGAISVLTGWAIHKPQQLGWLQGLFGGYDYARLWHFWLIGIFIAFVIPHILLVIADGWDTMRSMIVGWSDRVPADK